MEGKLIKINRPEDAVKLGIGFVTEDRKRQGLLLDSSICHNISLPILKRLSKFGIIDVIKERQVANQKRKSFI